MYISKLKSILVLTFFFLFGELEAQIGVPSPAVPSGNTAIAKQIMEISNDFYNGKVNVSIPLASYSLSQMSADVNLVYSSGNGIRPDELPGWVGSGWSLIAGGFVHRTVRGRPDEVRDFGIEIEPTLYGHKKKTTLNSQDFSYINNKQMLNVANWNTKNYANSLCSGGGTNLGSTNGSGVAFANYNPAYDLVPDEYSFSLGGVSGKFYLNSENEWVVNSSDGRIYNIDLIVDQLTLIDEISAANGARIYYKTPRIIKGMVITSIDGIKYYFGSINQSSDLKNQCFEFSQTSQITPSIGSNYGFSPTATLSGNDGPTYLELVPHTWHLTKIENIRTGENVLFSYKPGVQFATTRSAWGGGNVSVSGGFLIYNDIQYYQADPENVFSQYPLSVKSRVLTRNWILEQISFSNEVRIEFESSLSTQLSSNQNILYDNVSTFYPYEVLTMGIDVPTDRKNMLWQLNELNIYFGNKLENKVEFEYGLSPSNRLRLLKVKEISGEETFNEHSFIYNSTPGLQLPPYAAGKVDHWGFFNNKDFFNTVTPPTNGNVFASLQNYNSYRSPDSYFSQAEILTGVTYPTGGQTLFVYEPHTYAKERSKVDFSIANNSIDKEGGGVRIKKLYYYNNLGVLEYQKDYEYLVPGSSLSSGVLSKPPQEYLRLTNNGSIYEFKADGFDPIYYDGNHITYTYVTEYQSGIGKTIYQYTNYDNGFNDSHTSNKDLSVTPIYTTAYLKQSFKRGKLLSVQKINQDGVLLNEMKYKYEHDRSEANKPEIRSLYFDPNGPSGNFASISEKLYNNYLIEKEEIIYSGGNSVSAKQVYEYDVFGNLKKLEMLNSNGYKISSIYKYCHEYDLSNVSSNLFGLKVLDDLEIKSEIVEKIVLKENLSTGSKDVISGDFFDYHSEYPFVKAEYDLQISEPLSYNVFSWSSIDVNGAFTKNSLYKLKTNFDSYDVSGKIKSVTTRNGQKLSWVWGYNNTYPVTEVVGASHDEVFFSSFEEAGNWSAIVNDPARFHSGRFSGKLINENLQPSKVSALSSKVLKLGVGSSRRYKYSAWYYSNGPQAEVVLIMKKGTETQYSYISQSVSSNNINAWTFIEGEVDLASDVFELSMRLENNGYGNIWFDDIRLHPSNAQMKSYTYTPLVGMTSSSDRNSKITYYEYDGFGRLHVVKDENRNVLKRICYNYAGQPEPCKIYYNVVQSQTFTRSNCGSNYQGSSYTYTVNANTYVGSSQEEANQLALDDIALNGQVAANSNGTCTLAYRSADVSGYYFNQNCSPNTGEAIYVSMPAGSVISPLSQNDANTNAVNAAQDYANMHGSCLSSAFNFTATNSSSTGMSIVLTNISTNVSMVYNIGSYMSDPTFLGVVEFGYYAVELIPDMENYTFNYAIGDRSGSTSNYTYLSGVYLDNYNYILQIY